MKLYVVNPRLAGKQLSQCLPAFLRLKGNDMRTINGRHDDLMTGITLIEGVLMPETQGLTDGCRSKNIQLSFVTACRCLDKQVHLLKADSTLTSFACVPQVRPTVSRWDPSVNHRNLRIKIQSPPRLGDPSPSSTQSRWAAIAPWRWPWWAAAWRG